MRQGWFFVEVCLCFVAAPGKDVCPDGSCDDDSDEGSSLLQIVSQRVQPKAPSHEYPWSGRGGAFTTKGSTLKTAPADFSKGPTWVWKNDLDEQVRHSPLIDSDMNIYVTTQGRIRKFASDGTILWTWRPHKEEGFLHASPALYEGAIFAYAIVSSGAATMYSIDMAHGTLNWKKSALRESCACDSPGVFVYNRTMIIPLTSQADHRGNNVLYAASTTDGSNLWEYIADDDTWNFALSTPQDGSLIWASQCGGVYRITFEGKLIWRKGRPNPGHWCGTGGGSLGPNGVFYAEYSDVKDDSHIGAHIDAYRVSDGALLWNRTFGLHDYGWQYPAVGRLGPNGPLAVVAAVGMLTDIPETFRKAKRNMSSVSSDQFAQLSNASHAFSRELSKPLPEDKQLRNAVVAMDASSGEILWRFDEKPWPHMEALGDEKWLDRALRGPSYMQDLICLPDIQGIPLIAGDGTVYASSSHNGDLRAIKDVDGDGIIDASEVSVFSTGKCFLNSPSLAQGMLVAAPCWGPMYIFKDSKM